MGYHPANSASGAAWDRIGQESEEILCYSFLPAEGVEKLLRLRGRVRQRLHENAEVVGTDEAFFEDEQERQELLGLYNEKAGILDGDSETEVDLSSYAYQIWKNAIDRSPVLERIIPASAISGLFNTAATRLQARCLMACSLICVLERATTHWRG